MCGGLGTAQWSQLIYPNAIVLVSAARLVSRAAELNATALVAFSGLIGFVDLMAPHF